MNPRTVGERYWHLLLYVFVTALTIPFYQADVREYCEQILASSAGQEAPFWEFEHLILRPIGLLLWRLLGGLIERLLGFDSFTQVAAILFGLAWLGGALAIHSLRRICEALGIAKTATAVTLVAFLFTSSVLNFSQALGRRQPSNNSLDRYS